MGLGRPPLFKGLQATGTTIVVPVRIVAGCIGLHVSWPDATTAASFVLELSSFPEHLVPLWAGGAGTEQPGGGKAFLSGASAQFWPNSGETIAPVVAGAAGAFIVNVSNVRQQRARLRITTTANSSWEIYEGTQDV